MASFKAKQLSKPLVIGALLLAFAAISPLGVALGQTAPGSPIVSDVQVAGGTERVLFLGVPGARAVLVLLPGGDGIIGLDTGGGAHQLGSNFLVRTFSQWAAQGFAVVLPDAPNGTSLAGQRHLPAYADAISKAIDVDHSRAALPVWLIGTSAGTTAAVNGAAHLGSKGRPIRSSPATARSEPRHLAMPDQSAHLWYISPMPPVKWTNTTNEDAKGTP
jgi:hypothetical protein